MKKLFFLVGLIGTAVTNPVRMFFKNEPVKIKMPRVGTYVDDNFFCFAATYDRSSSFADSKQVGSTYNIFVASTYISGCGVDGGKEVRDPLFETIQDITRNGTCGAISTGNNVTQSHSSSLVGDIGIKSSEPPEGITYDCGFGVVFASDPGFTPNLTFITCINDQYSWIIKDYFVKIEEGCTLNSTGIAFLAGIGGFFCSILIGYAVYEKLSSQNTSEQAESSPSCSTKVSACLSSFWKCKKQSEETRRTIPINSDSDQPSTTNYVYSSCP